MQPDIYIYETTPPRRDQSGHRHLRDTENVCTNMAGSLPHVQVHILYIFAMYMYNMPAWVSFLVCISTERCIVVWRTFGRLYLTQFSMY